MKLENGAQMKLNSNNCFSKQYVFN